MKRDLNAVPLRVEPVKTFVQVRSFYGCSCPTDRYRAPSKEELAEIVRKSGFTLAGEIEKIVVNAGTENHGFYCYIPLLESHVAMDAWPDRGNAVQIILHFCNFSRDNHDRANMLFAFLREYFLPAQVNEMPELPAPI